MTQKISDERKMAYYLGMALIVIGGLLFASVFVSSLSNAGNFDNFESRTQSFGIRAFAGMALMIVGGIIRGIGAKGLAGSGAILNPEKAREDLKPYSKMAGGMVKDALEEADVKLGGKSERVIVIKCGECGKLNEEDSKFCQECGAKI